MIPTFTKDGITIQNNADVLAELDQKYKDIYGQGIDLSQNTPDGQRLGISSKMSADLQAFALALYNSRDPDFALGNDLIQILKICGINVKPATRSTVIVDVVTDRDLTLPVNFKIADNNNQNWVLIAPETVNTGTTSITFHSETWGKVEALANTINTVITVVLGVVSVNNPLDAVTGVDEETPQQIRIRRNKSLQNPAFSTVGALYAKLANLSGVTDLQVYENDTDSFDPEDPVTETMPPHSIWVVIDGGTNADIAETMAKQKTDGCAMKGSSFGVWTETLTRPNGTTFPITHKMYFDRPSIATLFVRLTATRKVSTQPVDIPLIKKFLVTKEYLIGDPAQANELYGYVYQAGNNFIATDLEISLDEITWTAGQIDADWAEELTITTASITVNEVI